MDFAKTVNHLRQSFKKQTTKDLKFRNSQLLKFQQMINLNENKILAALNKDLCKSESEATLTEVLLVKNEVRLMLNNLNKFAQKTKSDKNLVSLFDSVYTRPEPLGVVLIISAWNYPVYLSLMPLIGAIAAGNSAILKPSELAPNTAKLLEELIDKFLDKDYYKVINGGKEDTDQLLNERFDKILFTGSTNVGRIVYQKAAKHLTPCVLELGGKSPCYINDDVLNNLEIVCKRLLFGKLVCLGQTCVAPDYLLCSQKVQDKILKIIPKIINQQYGENPETSSNLCRIITENHFERLRKLIESSKDKIVFGGQMNKEKKYIAPTVLTNINGNEPIMQEEIFGPILPIKTIDNIDEAINFINSREKPLTLYVFTENQKIKNRFINETSSGSVCVNDTIIQLSVDNLPFGGVGESGMGSYHGRHSFNTFSHQKSVLEHSWNPIVQLLEMSRYLPPTEIKSFVIKELITYRSIMDFKFSSVLWFFVGLSSAIFAQFFIR